MHRFKVQWQVMHESNPHRAPSRVYEVEANNISTAISMTYLEAKRDYPNCALVLRMARPADEWPE